MKEKIPLVAVVGPTATGKTALGIEIAKRFHGEIVSCDSMQIYRGLPIGTAQPTEEERRAAVHHLVSFLDLTDIFSVSDYVERASQVAAGIHERNRLPVLVGGTGLYARSLLRGFSFEENCRDDSLRQELFQRAEQEGPEALYRELQSADPLAAAEIHPNNLKRVIRALEYCRLAGEPFSAQAQRSKSAVSPYRYLMLCLSFRDRDKLYKRINERVDRMLEAGLLQEAERFYTFCAGQKTLPTAAQAIGYKELFPYFEKKVTLEEAVENIKRESRRYAKRQITWFSREPEARFIYLDEVDGAEKLFELCAGLIGEFLSEKEAAAGEQ